MRALKLLAFAAMFAACAGQPDSQVCTTGITCPEGTKCAAVQAVCITNDCGDGIRQGTEACDDGNIVDGDGCAATCGSLEACGDGVLNAAAGELCDDGNTTGGDGCAADCVSVEICGNGTRDVNEVCDDGNTVPGDGCNGNCTSNEICGNGIKDINEKCDDGTTPGGCNADCQGGTGCGDGAIDRDIDGTPLEECDDGNDDNFDDCTTGTCLLNSCGDGIVQTSGSRIEQCDGTGIAGTPGIGGETASCNIDCTSTACGDGKLNNAANEQCDEGAGNNADNRDCTAACQLNVCNDGLHNTAGPARIEQCDDGDPGQLDACSDICTNMGCGNGVRENTEACDDFNLVNGDGCNSSCQFERCGDGIINDGEQCDGLGTAMMMGTPGETAMCNVNCTTRSCGDGIVNKTAGEECDDKNADDFGPADFCRNTTCKLNYCGDGALGVGEGCDDGNQNNTDACNNDCAVQTCGDGIRQGTEQCDDGNQIDTDACRNTCVLEFCGDSVTRTVAPIEQCDAGAGNGVDKNCLPTCKNNVCGDGFRDLEAGTGGTEACDDGDLDTELTCPYGQNTCTACNMGCTAVLNLTGSFCGDGVTDAGNGEACDDNNNTTESACPYGAASGTCQICNGSCQLANETGPWCGDGTVDTASGEVCDDRSPTQTCGQCSDGCNTETLAAAATGVIVAGPGQNNSFDGATFTIGDGTMTRVFEYDTANDGVTAGRVEVDAPAASTATQVRDEIQDDINNNSGLNITATDIGSSGLLLTNDTLGSHGNVDIDTSIGTATILYVSGMSGGAARDCSVGEPCKNDADCLSGNCNNGGGSPTFLCQ